MSLASWQSDNFNSLKNKKIIDFILPGTHNSGSYEGKFDLSLPPAVYHQPIIKFIHSFRVYWNFLEKWSVCQDKNFYEQLKSGIRSFDMRFCLSSDNKWRLHHSFYAGTIDDAIEQFERFFSEHPNEVVIWRIWHGGCSKNRYNGWAKFIKNKTEFNKKIYNLSKTSKKYPKNISAWPGEYIHYYRCTYKNMVENNKNIYIMSNDYVNYSYGPNTKTIESSEKWNEYWLKQEASKSRWGAPSNVYGASISPDTMTFVQGFICYGYPIMLLICLIIIALRLYVIFSRANKTRTIYNIITDIVIIIVCIFVCTFIGRCAYTKAFWGLKGTEPEYQNRLINVLKRNKSYIKYINVVQMDFPTDKNIKWVINQNFQQDKY